MSEPAAGASADELLLRLRHFRSDYFPRHQQRFQDLVAEGQIPSGAAETTTPGSTGVLGDPDSATRKAANRKRGGYGPDWDGDGKPG